MEIKHLKFDEVVSYRWPQNRKSLNAIIELNDHPGGFDKKKSAATVIELPFSVLVTFARQVLKQEEKMAKNPDWDRI